MGKPITLRQKIEICTAAALIFGYLLLPPILTGVCSAPEADNPGAYALPLNSQGQESGTTAQGEPSPTGPQVGRSEIQQAAQSSNAPDGPPESWGKAFVCEMNIADWLIGLFTLFLFIATYFLWRETERLAGGADDQAEKMAQSIGQAARAANAMECVAASMGVSAKAATDNIEIFKDTSRRQMRAYVCTQYNNTFPQDDNAGIRFEPRLRLINTGRTPAHRVRYSASADILPVPLPADFKFPLRDPSDSAGVLGPDQNFIIAAIVPNMLAPQEVAAAMSGLNKALYIWGTATYEDVFGEPHYTNFCQSILWYDNSSTMSTNTARHNDAD